MQNRKRKWQIVFICAVMVVCLLPFVGMTFARTDETTEKKELAELPHIVQDGKFNPGYLSGLGEYFSDHFAFRQQLVSADSLIRGRVFGVSSVERVTVGKDGWLFYTDTLDDFTASNRMTERELFNIANNLAITQQYVISHGADFAFTIAPNKNSLYPQYMPYTYKAAPFEEHNAIRLVQQLEKRQVNYTDLFALFKSRDDILYLERDSHWNNRGALLVCGKILENIGRQEIVFDENSGRTTADYVGDLNSMIYPRGSVPEENVQYDISGYELLPPARSVEDPVIETSCSDGDGALLMFRDSFGNTMLPFMAKAYNEACFVRSEPYDVGLYMEINQPNAVVIEIVERNLDRLLEMPPILESDDVFLPVTAETKDAASVSVCEPEENIMYWRFDGAVKDGVIDSESGIYIRLSFDDGTSVVKEAFTVKADGNGYGYKAYINKDTISGENAQVEIIAFCGGVPCVVGVQTVCFGDISPAFFY